jgi:DNA replication protein DnaC
VTGDDELGPEARAQREEFLARCEDECRQRFPRRFITAAATHPEVTAWCDAYAAAAKAGRPPAVWSLVIVGPFGTGKTWQAYGAVRRIALSGVKVRWMAASLPDLLDELRPHNGRDSHAEYEKWAAADLLLVDDLGAEKVSEWSLTTLGRIVNHRSAYLLPTIWTTNLPQRPRDRDRNPPRTLKSELDGWVYSRLCESAFVTIKGEDRRQPPAAS